MTPAQERDAIMASPLDPNVEYVQAVLASRAGCHCPRTVLDDGVCSWRLKILHVGGCEVRAIEAGPVLERRQSGVHPCPDCRNLAFTVVPAEWKLPGWRRCDGPHGCGRGFLPADAARGRRPLQFGERPAAHRARRAA